MFQEVLIPEGWGMRAGVAKEWVWVTGFLSLGKAPFRAVCLSTRVGVCCGAGDRRRVSLSHGRDRPLPSVLHLMEAPLACAG